MYNGKILNFKRMMSKMYSGLHNRFLQDVFQVLSIMYADTSKNKFKVTFYKASLKLGINFLPDNYFLNFG